MARFFIDRPIFAWVIAIVIMLVGTLSIMTLPVAQYPNIAPPAIRISATYPGASPQTVQDSVVQVIEQQMSGLDYLIYMASTADMTGRAEITLTFSSEADPNIAQVQVQNKLQLATPLLPEAVQKQGISVVKRSVNIVKLFSFISHDPKMKSGDIADYVASNLQDAVSRLPGVGEVTLFGSLYGMRIWMNPHELRKYSLMPSDIMQAIIAQNAQISAGQLGQLPNTDDAGINLAISLQDRLQTPEQFANVIIRTNPDGSMVRVRDVARVEVGSDRYWVDSRFNRQPVASLAINLASGANALDVVKVTGDYLESMKPFFPEGMEMVTPYDSTPYVRISIKEVVKTLLEAVVLVFVIMFLFLQNIRATLIPTIAVPVVLLGTFGVLAALGYSINTLTMFALVLAIGLLVDDAIVVVENVERVMREDKLPPKEATRKSMDQITSALIGITCVLSAVFVPMAFFGGSVGVIYRQFSVTIVSAMILSVIVAIVFTPALCATMLKDMPDTPGHGHAQQGFFGWFNRTFEHLTMRYKGKVGSLAQRTGRCMIIYLLLIGGVVLLFRSIPTGFLPDEDQGNLFVQIMMPVGTTQEATAAVMKKVEDYLLENEKDNVENLMALTGFSFAGRGQNAGMCFVRLRDWSERKRPDQHVKAIAQRAQAHFATFKEGMVFAFIPPAMVELGNATGFDLQLQDKAGVGRETLIMARNQLLGMAAQSPILRSVRPNGQEDQPQMRVIVDREKAGALGLDLSAVNNALSAIWGSAYVDDFLHNGRVKKVYVQGDAPYRMTPEDMKLWHFRNKNGEMVPFTAFATLQWEYAPARLERYNGLPSLEILGMPAPGYSSGDAMNEMERLMAQLPRGIGYEWTGLSYQEKLSGNQAAGLYVVSILVVFLCLAALYESWSVPFAVILVVPLGIFGALLGSSLRSMYNDVYFQVGLLAAMGLSAKNAILIVEFAKDLHDGGMDLIHAVAEASRMRLRPILMTSLAFLVGILPLAISTGAGSGGQNAIGTCVMGGTFVATAVGIFYIPIFFVVVVEFFKRFKRGRTAKEAQ